MLGRKKSDKITRKKILFWQILYFAEFIIILLLANLLFFYFYYKDLSLHFSLITIFFIALFVFDYVLSLQLFRHLVLRVLLALIYAAIIVYALINFVYFEVFGVFLRLNVSQIAGVNKPLLELLSSYYLAVPAAVYFFAAALLVLLFIGSGFYWRKDRNLVNRLEHLYRQTNFVHKRKKKRYASLLVLTVAFILVNAFFYQSLNIYKERMIADDFSRVKYFSDLGVYGYLFSEFSNYLVALTKKTNLLGDLATAQEAGNSSSQATTTAKNLPLSDLEIIKDNLAKMSLLESGGLEEEVIVAKLDKPNVIIYQMESVGYWPLKQEPNPMPFLSQLIKENISVENFFANSCITVNAEFAALCSFFPESSGPISDLFSYNNYYCLPSLLKEKYGYKSFFYHANSAQFWNREALVPRWGFDQGFFTPYFKPRQDDSSVLAAAVKKIKETDGPSFNYIVGFTSHGPHDKNFVSYNLHNNNVEIKPYEKELNENSLGTDQKEETIRLYFGFLSAVDKGIENLFSELEKNDLLDKTIVIITNDHRYYNFKTKDRVNDFFNYNKIPFVMYVPGGKAGKIRTIASLVDIAPTLLNLIEGENYQLPESFVGKSLFSSAHPNSAVSKCLGQNLYISRDLILENDSLLPATVPIIYFNKDAWEKLGDYSENLVKVVKYSDKVVAENKLASKVIAASNNFQENEIKKIDYNQETDEDKDGLSNLREKSLGTDPKNPDTDGDGFLDGVEVIFGWNPLGSEGE